MATASRAERSPGPGGRGVFGGGAWPIGRVAGIPLALDHTWVVIFLLVTVSLGTRLRIGHETWSVLAVWSTAVATSVLFFASILLHELGHSLVGQRLGVRVRSITLFVFGGVAQLESEPRRPRDEILIALAGPLVSVAVGGIFVAFAAGLRSAGGTWEPAAEGLAWLGRINLVLAVFNLVPGFPLDGGRVLRGIVWGVTGSFERATEVAAASGSLFAYSLTGFGILTALVAGQLLGGLWLAFIGWFLLSAARATVGQVVLERILGGVQVRDAMEPAGRACVSGAETVGRLVAEVVLRRGVRTFYVVDPEGGLRGLVTLRELATVPSDAREGKRLEEIMIPVGRLEVLAPGDTGWTAFRRMAERNVNQLPVLEGGRLVGTLTRERLVALVQSQLALAEGQPGA